jgi:hypothetical protein
MECNIGISAGYCAILEIYGLQIKVVYEKRILWMIGRPILMK